MATTEELEEFIKWSYPIDIVEVDDEAIEFYKKGEIEYQNFNYTEAIAHFEKAKELGSVDAYYYLSNFYS